MTTLDAEFSLVQAKANQLGRKFEEWDISPTLATIATQYARHYQGDFDYMVSMRDRAFTSKGLSNRMAKGVLNCLLAEIKRDSTPRVQIAVEDSGVYVLPENVIVKVQTTRPKFKGDTNLHTYTKRWIEIRGERLNENEAHVRGEWIYEPRLMGEVANTGHKMTLAEAKAFILRYGQCVRCGRTLKDATSVENGIGPVCIKYFTGGALEALGVQREAEQVAAAAERKIDRSVTSVDRWLDEKGYAF